MAGFMDKVGDFFFKSDEEAEEYRDFEEQSAPVEQKPAPKKAAKKSNLISVPTRGKNNENLEIVLFKAVTYDDMQEIARHIKERKVAVVNFEDMDKAVAQRMVDFLSGAVFALDGVPRKVSGGTFIFSSSQVDLSGQIMDGDSSFEAEDFTGDDRFSSNQWLRS
ncbi:MAG: cell division protein SepF [Firmicutes bacterium]|nr:cell division protein SepF [Bacillota bacterium]